MTRLEITERAPMGRWIKPLAGALLVAGLAACGSDSGEETAADTAGTPPSETTVETAGETIDVTFDGSECIVAEPSEVPPGEYSLLFTDDSDLGAVLFARQLVDGYTYQDALDAQEEAGGPGSYWPRPAWAADVDPHFNPPEIDLADNQQLLNITVAPGNHLIALYTTEGPELIWTCGPLDVVEP